MLFYLRSCGAVAKPMPETATKNTLLAATKFTLVAHHKECTTPFLNPDTNEGTRNKTAGI
ncbi:MAG: hypothetical protein NVV73_13310 [Cellvibrionaceae bacterium]|nr:hypothetical protein [Cellvibrionaceae bacterium]